METIVHKLLSSNEPSIRYKTLTGIYGLSEGHTSVQQVREEIRNCARIKALLKHRNKNGEIDTHPYKKWQGAFWTLSILAELGYPAHDPTLIPLREQVYRWMSSKQYQKNINLINGRFRHCASMEGNAALSLLKLGLADERVDELINRLVEWQWLDGGWNCDKRPEASHSSFMESWLPLRAMAQFGESRKDQSVFQAIQRACELFLTHEIYKRSIDDSVILKEFLWLRYPRYWHYDILGALIMLGEASRLNDPRCLPALNLLKEMMLPNIGYRANGRYYQLHHPEQSGYSPVDWGTGQKGKTAMNEFITVEAFTILRKAGMLPKLELDTPL
ncbi:MAG: hypothetical protein JW704_12195 [Anaerolineaceae bacterium]|nr:hypothetical protein [Anaerolineaceae bacterium]MBN2677614.1 hypothetical protein [Anaerolineaceae bacterium]